MIECESLLRLEAARCQDTRTTRVRLRQGDPPHARRPAPAYLLPIHPRHREKRKWPLSSPLRISPRSWWTTSASPATSPRGCSGSWASGCWRPTAPRRPSTSSGSPSSPIDLVLLDVVMPETDGVELAEQILAHQPGSADHLHVRPLGRSARGARAPGPRRASSSRSPTPWTSCCRRCGEAMATGSPRRCPDATTRGKGRRSQVPAWRASAPG